MRITLRAVCAALIITSPVGCSAQQSSAARSLDENALREYAGVYQWSSDSFVYLQPWAELTGKNQLVAFDRSGCGADDHWSRRGRGSITPVGGV